MKGVTIKLPSGERLLARIAKPFPDDAHIESVLRDQEWRGGGGFQLLLDLDDSAMPADLQGSSETMTATALLNHYFGDLEKLGLRNRGGSGGGMMAKVQSAQNEWWNEPDQTVSIEGSVFVSPDAKQAILNCTVRERLAK